MAQAEPYLQVRLHLDTAEIHLKCTCRQCIVTQNEQREAVEAQKPLR